MTSLTQGLFLQIRIEQVLTGSLPLVLCFKLSQLLAFYGRTVEQMMGSNAHLTHTLVECHQLSNRVFHEQLKARGSRLLHHKAAPLKDLAVPQQVRPTHAAAAAAVADALLLLLPPVLLSLLQLLLLLPLSLLLLLLLPPSSVWLFCNSHSDSVAWRQVVSPAISHDRPMFCCWLQKQKTAVV